MRVLITGATGFIGKTLCKELSTDYEVVALSRSRDRAAKVLGNSVEAVQWDGKTASGWEKYAENALGIINLAGENISSGRWTRSKEARILESRLAASGAVLEAVQQAQVKPKVVVQASAVGYYGNRYDEELDETSASGDGFLASVCRQWESFSEKIQEVGVRCVVIRSGIVLGHHGGALRRLTLPFRYYLGGYPGSGKQWLSWISLDDEVAAIKFLMNSQHAEGAFNLTAPRPITAREFCRVLAKATNRPCWFSIPAWILRLVAGEMAVETFLSGQKVFPKRLIESGFQFRYHDIESALLGAEINGREQ